MYEWHLEKTLKRFAKINKAVVDLGVVLGELLEAVLQKLTNEEVFELV